MKDRIEHRWQFNHPPQKVWEYLTSSELLAQWLGKIDFKPIVGHQFEVAAKTGAATRCEVTEVTPFTRMSWSWKYTSAKNKKVFDSTVVFTLLPTSNGTELHLVHHGFGLTDDYVNHNNGWSMLGQRLANLLSTTL